MAVFLSPLAERKIELLLEYLEKEWGTKVKEEFLQILIHDFKLIEKYPKSKIQSKSKKQLFKSIVTKHTSYFYRIKRKDIEVITVIDNRQNPKKALKELKNHFL